MTTAEKVVCRERQKKKQETLEFSPSPLRKKRGRKQRSPSPPPSPPLPSTISFFKVMVGDFKDVLYIPPMAACTLNNLDKKYVYIEDANGKYWTVRISMVGGSLAFQKGWGDFFSAHSISAGEFVLFTYSGGLLFTARIFGTSSLERVDFQIKKRRGRYAKERCNTELKPDNLQASKRKKTFHSSEGKHSPSTKQPLRLFKRCKEAALSDFPSAPVVESAPISGVLKIPSSCEKPLQYDTNAKESENVISCSDQTWHRNVDATVKEVNTIEELNIVSPTKQVNSGTENFEAVGIESTRKRVFTTEKVASVLHSDAALVSKQENMTRSGIFAFETQSDIKEWLPEMSKSHEMGSSGKMEESNAQNIEILDSEPHNDNMDVLYDLQRVECSKMKFCYIESDGIVDKVVQTADDSKEGLPEMSKSHEMGSSCKTEESNAQSIEILDNEPHNDNMDVLSDHQHVECSKMKFNNIESDGIVDKVVQTIDNIKEGLPEASEAHEMGSSGKMEASNAQNIEILNSEPHNDNMDVLSDLQRVECSKMKFNNIESDGIVDKVVHTADEICYTVDKKIAELAIGTGFYVNGLEEPICKNEEVTFDSETCVPCETISIVSSNPILSCASNKKKNSMPSNKVYGNPQINGNSIAEACRQRRTRIRECKYKSSPEIRIAQDESLNEDEKDITPCSSCRSRTGTDRKDAVDLPSSNCSSFSVCLSDDVHPSLELPKKLTCQMGKLKNERKIVVLQDLSMKCWPILYHQNPNFIGFIGGWVDFARANNICKGDICEFELVNKMELKFQVHITKHEGPIFDQEFVDGHVFITHL